MFVVSYGMEMGGGERGPGVVERGWSNHHQETRFLVGGLQTGWMPRTKMIGRSSLLYNAATEKVESGELFSCWFLEGG